MYSVMAQTLRLATVLKTGTKRKKWKITTADLLA